MNNSKKIFEEVFFSHRWGDSTNAGKSYTRPYSKTHGKDFPANYKTKH